ncbi:DUF916 and DUF3324 domain-containing protein [Enterococcus sp. DIV0756]|uniref:DUF916 and DUF3324 domain-containing protein n=1 Tax=Enterococcus sp. DIV0756 TaxID=2774636 RepID=UPI003F240EB3
MNGLIENNSKRSLFIVTNLFLLLLTIFGLLFPMTVFGEESGQIGRKDINPRSSTSTSGVGFTVEPVLTDTQIDPSKGYYFIRVEPGKIQAITLRVKSTIKESRTVSISVKDAFTNGNGAIDYNGTEFKRDKSLMNSLEEMSSVSSKKVTVKNLETKEVTIKIHTPVEPFTGVKMAAICAISHDNNDKENKEGLSSAYGYRIGLIVTEEEEIEIDNGASLNLLKVKPTVNRGKRVIQSTFQNPEPKILKNLTVETKLRRKGNEEVLRMRKTNSMRMAPNSQFHFDTNWGLDPIAPGTYVLSMKAHSDKKNWTWKEEFTIGEEQAKKINEEATYTITYPKWVPIIVILLGALTICSIGMLYVRRKKWSVSK